MSAHAIDRIAYCNGRVMRENDVPLSSRDRSFRDGDAVFDSTRTFAYRLFRLPAHVERLYRSPIYGRIDPGISPAGMYVITAAVLERNRSPLAPEDDCRVSQRTTRGVLPGTGRQTGLELAGGLGIPGRQTDLDLYDAYNADEAFLTSTSLCICPVRSINGSRVGSEQVFGTITRRLIEAYGRLVDCDFVAQYRRPLD